MPNPRKPFPKLTGSQERLVSGHMGLIKEQAGRLAYRMGGKVEAAELWGYGWVGLVRAAAAWRADRDVPFRKYAWRRVWGAMMDGIRELDWVAGRRYRQKVAVPMRLFLSEMTFEDSGRMEIRGESMTAQPSHESRMADTRESFEHLTRFLTARTRRMLWMYYVEGYKMHEIGEHLGRCEASVSVALARAKATLRRLIPVPA